MRTGFLLLLLSLAAALLSGCILAAQVQDSRGGASRMERQVDFTDPLLNRRQILLFGTIDRQAAEITIQKLLYLDGRSEEPIDLFLQTPGGEFKDAMAIEEVMRLLKSRVNTYALSECNSGGAVLLAAGSGKRRAFHGAVVVIHGIKIYGRPPAGMKDKLQDAYTDFWRTRAKLPEKWLPLPNDVLHVLTAEQALEYGVVDEVVGK
jgi:ATP-dependent Clp protease protease subunit